LSKINILVAYPYFSKTVHEELKKQSTDDYRLIVDSGAFSAYNSGHIIELDKYCEFLKTLEGLNYNAVQLDVVFNPEATKNNYKEMKSRGFDVCPVFTRGDDFNYLDELTARGEYIFVGGVQGINPEAKYFAKQVLERTKGKKIHYLAFVRPDFLNHYKPYSTDSSTWSGGSRFGKMYFYAGGGRISSMDRTHFKNELPIKFKNAVKKYGVDDYIVKELAKNETWHCNRNNKRTIEIDGEIIEGRKLLTLFSAIAYVYYMYEAEKKLGTKIYLACCTVDEVKCVFNAQRFLRNRGLI